MFVAMSQFEQWAIMKFFCLLGKSAIETLVSLSAVDGDKALKKLLFMTDTTNLITMKNQIKNEEHLGRLATSRNGESAAKVHTVCDIRSVCDDLTDN
jgi:hypothetical protein